MVYTNSSEELMTGAGESGPGNASVKPAAPLQAPKTMPDPPEARVHSPISATATKTNTSHWITAFRGHRTLEWCVRVPFARAKCLHSQMAKLSQEQMYDNAGLAMLRAMETVLQAVVIKQVKTLPKPASVHN